MELNVAKIQKSKRSKYLKSRTAANEENLIEKILVFFHVKTMV